MMKLRGALEHWPPHQQNLVCGKHVISRGDSYEANYDDRLESVRHTACHVILKTSLKHTVIAKAGFRLLHPPPQKQTKLI